MGIVDTLRLKEGDHLTYYEAVNNSKSNQGGEVTDVEIESMHQNQVWYLVNLRRCIVPSKY